MLRYIRRAVIFGYNSPLIRARRHGCGAMFLAVGVSSSFFCAKGIMVSYDCGCTLHYNVFNSYSDTGFGESMKYIAIR